MQNHWVENSTNVTAIRPKHNKVQLSYHNPSQYIHLQVTAATYDQSYCCLPGSMYVPSDKGDTRGNVFSYT